MAKAIYETGGRAKEYCPLAVNLYQGCVNGCYYCYVPTVKRQQPAIFHQRVTPRRGVLEQLAKDAPHYRGREVQFCFLCDPYPQIEEELLITRQAIEILHANGVIVRILTKAGGRSVRDFDLLKAKPELSRYGATLTFTNRDDSLRCEPKAAEPLSRVNALILANAMGIPTWASLEPVIEPIQTLDLIRTCAPYVDVFKVGKLNHIDSEIDWANFARDAIRLLRSLGKTYYIKNDLYAYLRKDPFMAKGLPQRSDGNGREKEKRF